MGLDFSKFEWTPNTMGKNWMSVCNFYGNMMPFMGQTLWQVGPMPFITQGWFPNTNYGNWGDQFVSSYTPGAGGGGGSTNLTEEQKAKLKTQKKGIIDYNKKYNAMLDALTEYKKTLKGDAKDDFETDLSIEHINLSSKRSTSVPSSNNLTTIENSHKEAKKAYEDLLKIYKEYNEDNVVSKAYEESLENIKTTEANNKNYASTVDDLSTWINNPENIEESKIIEIDNGSYKWDSSVDVMELLSTWNSKNNNRLISQVIEKYNNIPGTDETENETKDNLENFTKHLCSQLRDRAEGIDKKKLTNENKTLLTKALEDFPKSITKSDLNEDLATEFDELYKAVRLAEAEIADKELREAFDFLGDENPYKNNNDNNLFNDAKADLKEERFDVDDVAAPPVNTSANPTTGGNEGTTLPANTPAVKLPKITIDGDEYYYDQKNKNFIDINDTKFPAEELEIEDFVLNEDGKYSYKKGDEVVTGNIQSE